MKEIKRTLAWLIYNVEHWQPKTIKGRSVSNLAQGFSALRNVGTHLDRAHAELEVACGHLIPQED